MIAAPMTLDEIREVADPDAFPCSVLEGCDTALVLFAAGFFGKQDAIFVADHGLRATCVDVDADRLDQMAAVYPTDWDFIEADVYEWAKNEAPAYPNPGPWDIVTVDCPSGHFDRCAALNVLWCRLAWRVVVLGCAERNREMIESMDDWELTEMRRRSNYDGGVYWAVLERA